MEKRRGRPKTKDYSTLMARIPQDLVDRVKQYASQHQQPISVLIRDALEYYMNADDILSYRYRNTSDIKENVSDTQEDSAQPAIVAVSPQDLQAMVDKAVQAALVQVNGTVTPTPEATEPGAELSHDDHSVVQDKGSQLQGERGAMRLRIVTLLREHPEGLSAEEIRVYLKPEKRLGDTLQGMVRQDLLTKQGSGQAVRYLGKAAQATDTRKRRKAQRQGQPA